MGTSTWSEAVRVLADELGRSGVPGLPEEEDRLHLADQLLVALEVRKYTVAKRTISAEPTPPQPTVISASRPVTVDELHSDPGMVVQRHTTHEEGSNHVETELPCCRRRMTFPADSDLEVDVVCQFDGLRYTLRLAEEWDGGLLACFEVGGPVMLAKRRPAKRRAR
ncbi:hypothetical protein E1286_38750 [Nonomuraea terrae]|uniref:Uncharacterized protein n=1 Tax=Nonomuraea terrae TaxID=2530383 RepID=A0A4R4XYI1_9ACTN|nr:hypothetical protein [Nonomuraea terrae]TDD36109.1 hypothetical protein E1286_38750 [Nonomuraea terrae]